MALVGVGVALATVRARWLPVPLGEPLDAFELGMLGSHARLAPDQVERWAAVARGPLRIVALAVAAVAGVALAGAFQRRAGLRRAARWPLAAGLTLAVFAAIDPALVAFVAERSASSAPEYLSLEHGAAGLGALAIAAGVVALLGTRRSGAAKPVSGAPSRGVRRASLAAAGLVAALVPELVRLATVGDVPLTNDGVAYRFQAELFAHGDTHQDLTPGHAFFEARQIWPGSAEVPRVFAKYPPGHSGLLAAGQLVGYERAFVLLGAAVSPWLVFALARALGLGHALLGAWLFALSPAVLAAFGSQLAFGTSVPAALAALAASAHALARWRSGRAPRPMAFAAGVALGVVALARPGTAAALAAALLVAAAAWMLDARAAPLATTRPRARTLLAGVVLPAALGLAPAAVLFVAYSAATTGDPWLSGYALYARELSPDDRWGIANFARAPDNTAFNVARLSTWLLGLGGGLVFVVLGVWSTPRPARALLVAPPLALVAFYALLTFHGVPWAGPVYLLESFGALALLAAAGLGALERATAARVLPVALALVPLASAGVLVRQGAAAAREAAARDAPRRAAVDAGITRGIVFVHLDTLEEEREIPLPPPIDAEPLLFARDLGLRNQALLDALPGMPAFVYDPETGELRPLGASD